MEEIKLSFTSILEDESTLRNRRLIFDDGVLEESDMKNNETVLTQEVITNLKILQKMKEI